MPRILCGRAIADILVREQDAEPVGDRLIKMIRGTAAAAIRRAKEIRNREKATKRVWALPFLFCAGCHKKMQFLSFPGREEKSGDPPPCKMENWSRTILHLGCNAAFVYSALDLRVQSIARTIDPNRPHLQQWRRVRFSCVEQHCEAQASIFVCLTSPISTDKLVAKIFDEQPRIWRCPSGHPVIYGKAQIEEVFRLN